MRSNVTAILVAKHSGETLTETIAAIRHQTVQPDRIIVIAAGPTALAEELGRVGFDRVIATGARSSFGQAVALGVQAATPSEDGRLDWLWLLAEDTAPEPEALERMLTTVQSTGTAAVAGPKLVDWDDPRLILELGQGLTWSGARWVIDRQELDQQQYDHTEDVLGVGPVGMFVRRDVWEKLEGFDPALPVVDDGLDFSVRARLAGYRVIVVPEARIRTKRSGVAGPEVRRSRSVMRRTHRQSRTAHLYRRVTYAPALLAPLLWLSLPFIGILRMLWSLIRERPGTMFGELRAALTVWLNPGRILRSRRRLRRHNEVGWRAVRPLRADRKTVKSVNMVRREAILASLGRQRRDLHFVSTGGLAVLIVSSVLSVAMTWWVFGASMLTGGGFAPLSGSLRELWDSTVSRMPADPTSLAAFAETAPADPFTWVLAVLGSLTFWNPSFALVLLTLLTIPLASLGGWMWGSRLSDRASSRVLSGILWGVSPVLLGALSEGRPQALILAAALPWLLHSLALATRSWSWAGVASLLAAVVLGAAPVLWPAAIVMLIAGMLTHPKQAGRILGVAIAPAVLVLPRALHAFANGRPLDLLVDPGIPVDATPATQWQMFLGFPTFGLDGWGSILTRFGIESTLPITLTVGLLLIPLAILALLGMYTGHPRFTTLASLAGALGLITALMSPKLLLAPAGDDLVPVWAGSGLALYWLSVISLAAVGIPMLFKTAPPVTAVAMAGAVLIVAPGMFGLVTGNSAITPDREQVPAVVSAESNVDPGTRTLSLWPLSQNEVRARILDGTGPKFDRVYTRDTTAPATAGAALRADLVAALASTGADDLDELLTQTHVKFVVLGAGDGGEASLLRSSVQAVLDQHPSLTSVGDTQHGVLWRVTEPAAADSSGGDTHAPADVALDVAPESMTNGAMWWIQVAVLLALLVLALPTGEVRELPQKRPRTGRRAAAAVGPVASSGAFGIAEEPSASEPEQREPEPVDTDPVDMDPVDDQTLFVKPADDVWELPDDDTIVATEEDRP